MSVTLVRSIALVALALATAAGTTGFGIGGSVGRVMATVYF